MPELSGLRVQGQCSCRTQSLGGSGLRPKGYTRGRSMG